MAGAFGYGADTFEISMQMAEASLLPAIRRADAKTLVVADGTSCRHQIADGTDRAALHVARVLAMSLDHSSCRGASTGPREARPDGAGPESISAGRGYGFRARAEGARPGMTNEKENR